VNYYTLDANGQPVACPDLHAWGRWYEANQEAKRIDLTEVGDVEVSTVFLGLDHNHRLVGPPVLFETMTFGGDEATDQMQWRYHTRDEAQRGHAAIVDALRHGEQPPAELCGGLLTVTIDGAQLAGPCRLPYGHEGNHKATVNP
jgi:hypothetical protein